MSEAADGQLIAQLLAGEQAAFDLLQQRYRPRLAGFLRGRLQLSAEETEDLVQDVFAALLINECAALRHYQSRASFYTYLCAIALRRVYRQHRRQPQVVDAADDAVPEPADDPTDQDLTATEVRRALRALPDQFRVALMLHHFGGMEYHEIADLLGVPANTVATRICRAKRRLRELLEL
jgi:RNA polymerase sigma-70 factor (ECF subfamily)